MTLAIGLAIRSAVMLAVGLLLSACLAKRSAALRHRVLVAALVASAAVFPLGLALPEYTVALPARAVVPGPVASPQLVVDAPPPGAEPAQFAPGPLSLIAVAWLAGAIIAAGMMTAGLVRVRRLAARASRVDNPRWLEILEDVAGRHGMTRAVVIARTDSAELLGTWGILRPHVLVPRQAHEWTLDRVHVVLCHELAHIRRHDWLVQVGAEALRAIFWFNPLVWIVCRRLRRESELACDDEVIGLGVGGRDYAAHLLDLARQCRRFGSRWAAAVPMANPSTLERRIAAMLNPRLDRRPPSRGALLAVGIGLLLVTVPVAGLRARQSGPAPLTGTIYDVSGGVLPGVQVTLVDANQVAATAASNADGRFEFPTVAPGKYVLSFAVPGFKLLRHEFELRDTRDWDRVFTLQLGDLRESITVRASRVSGAPAQPPAPGQPVRVGGNVRPPKKVRDVKPAYPPAMRDAGLTGIVSLEAIIGHDGTVTSVRVLSAQVHPDFAIAAVDAVRQWRFTPTLLNGEAVDVVMTVSVRFDLEG